MNPIRVAINGYGRIGRSILRAVYGSPEYRERVAVVAIHDKGEPDVLAHLTRYDTVHGRLQADVVHQDDQLHVAGDAIHMLQDCQLADLPWGALDVDVVMECTGRWTQREAAAQHLAAGASKVLVSAPGHDMDATVVYGVNHHVLGSSHQVVSNASCTTHCLAPLVKVLDDAWGVTQGFMHTVHAYTNDQNLVDGYHRDPRRARSAAQCLIPTRTGAAETVGLVLPHLRGKLHGLATRVPVPNVSLVDWTCCLERATCVADVQRAIRAAADGPLAGVLAYNTEPLVSVDFNHHPASSVVDLTQIHVQDRLLKVLSWYDNEWGFANRMLDVACWWCSV